ncbi:MAG TPA: type II toxin-antitoxin system VapC family toxin [bacterium]|nr:type II toxin-antitoxin system VapC family toxin [bacterium]HPO09692.1 type II toxin-antitoxin system VapC family toxin [bacterium]HQO35851.1 type II toxin-antitoxin system VapC family toxin [bacterium]
MMAEAFLDTAYAIALSSPNDLFHIRAISLAERLESTGVRLITTRAVLVEIGNSLSRWRYRSAAIELLDAIESDPNIRIVSVSEPLYLRALELYRERLDKEWGLTDCISFLVMQDYGITDALTTDVHFEQAGFRAMMREA